MSDISSDNVGVTIVGESNRPASVRRAQEAQRRSVRLQELTPYAEPVETRYTSVRSNRSSAQRSSVKNVVEVPNTDRVRSDSDIAREYHNMYNNPDQPGIITVSQPNSELGDEAYAAALYEQERANEEYRRSIRQQMLARGESFSYTRPKNVKPYFCRTVFCVTCIFMLLEIQQNDWHFESFQTNPTIGPSVETLVNMGAKSTELILEGQVYRLLTPVFLHAGILHLLFNMMGLYNIGFPAEEEFGHWRIGIIYIFSGIFGVICSSIFVPQSIGVGASGAIFGLFGSAWADLIHNWSLYGRAAKGVLCQLSFATCLNLTLGLMPFLDNFAHLGGFLCGLVLGFTMLIQHRYDFDGFRKNKKGYQMFLQFISIVAVPVMFVVMLLVLFLGVDAANECKWCSYISCVPMPPGVADEDLWWDCSPCSQIALAISNITTGGDYSINCPDGTSVSVTSLEAAGANLSLSVLQGDNSKVLNVCKEFCY